MINLLDNVARKREWLAKRRLRAGFARAARTRLDDEFQRVAQLASSAYLGERSVDEALRHHPENVQRIILATLVSAAMAFGERARKMIRKELGAVEKKDTEAELAERVSVFARDRARRSMARVSTTTRKQISKAIEQGLRDGDTRQEIADEIERRTGGKIGETRARTIADTEVHSASNAGELESVKLLDLPLRKEWLSMNDELVREDHQDVNGDEEDLDGTFDVGGETLSYPGDPGASPAQTVNCRCIMVYNESKKGST